MRGARVLVVGGAGFIGSNLVRRCLDDGCERVMVIDNLLSSERENLPEHKLVALRIGSIADDAVLDGIGDDVDYVFHLATYHGNQSSIANPIADHDNNLITTLKLFERLRGFIRLRRVVYASTGCALAAKDTDVATAVREDGPVPLDFDSPYQISKVVGEMYALYYYRQARLPVTRARFQNVYGPGELLGAGEWRGTPATVWRNVVPTFVYRALKGMPLTVHGNGASSRDFVYVSDIVDGLVRCATSAGAEGDVFNLASGAEVPIAVLAETVNRLAGNVAGIERLPARQWDRSICRVGAPEKARARLDFAATIDLETGLRRTIDWTVANMPHIDRCIARHATYHDVGLS
jgi:nucleoside-diphosphate-sugar epimerase